MEMRHRVVAACIALAVLAGCAPASPREGASGPGSASDGQPPARIKRVTAVMMGEVTSFIARMNTTQITPPGASVLEQLVHAAMAELNGEGKLQPQLAEAVPSLENGLWKLLPDGRMETTWTIRGGARWHDGTPVTGGDFLFATVVDLDRELPILRAPGYAWVERVEAPDPSTVVVTWARPYIDADLMFTPRFAATPLPRHLLEETFLNDKTRFMALPYWTDEFIGAGPFRVREFVPASSMVLHTYDDFLLGRPQIEEIEIRILLDLNTVVTNVLAGSVDLTLGRGFTMERAIELRDQWRDGRMVYFLSSWIVIQPQFINPSPAVVTDLQLRRALMHGTDRQQLVDTIQSGLSTVAHLYLAPSEPEYREVEDAVVRYEYDPRRATQLIEQLGYTKGADSIFRDRNGERLAVELRSNGERITENTIVPVANFWTQLGVPTEPNLVPPQRMVDREYVATFPGFRMMRQPDTASQINRIHSSVTPLPENRFVGSNYSRYRSAELDGLIDRFLTTIPRAERVQIFRQAMRHISENLNQMGLFYDAAFVFSSRRLGYVGASETLLWDVHKWGTQS